MPVGRPREFDLDEALDRALHVFWRKGYEGTTLPDLTEAMGINRPSLYAAFGNKESLFRKAFDRYSEGSAAIMAAALSQPTSREVVEVLLTKTAEALTNPKNPPGCLGVQGALSCGEAADPIRKELIARRGAFETALRERFERAIADGDLPANSAPCDLARFVATLIQGMSVQATSGASRSELQTVARIAIEAWPTVLKKRHK